MEKDRDERTNKRRIRRVTRNTVAVRTAAPNEQEYVSKTKSKRNEVVKFFLRVHSLICMYEKEDDDRSR